MRRSVLVTASERLEFQSRPCKSLDLESEYAGTLDITPTPPELQKDEAQQKVEDAVLANHCPIEHHPKRIQKGLNFIHLHSPAPWLLPALALDRRGSEDKMIEELGL